MLSCYPWPDAIRIWGFPVSDWDFDGRLPMAVFSVDTQWVHVVLLFGWKVCISPLFVTGVKISRSTTLLKIELAFYRLKPYGELLELISHSWMLKTQSSSPPVYIGTERLPSPSGCNTPFYLLENLLPSIQTADSTKVQPFQNQNTGGWLADLVSV